MKVATAGWINGLIGVIIFAGSLPATRVVVGQLSPFFVTGARAVIAALAGAILLLVYRQARPNRSDLPSLLVTAAGVVIGFPLLTAMALQYITAAHSIVFLGLLPLSTATFAVIRARERPTAAFWLFSISGAGLVVAYALSTGLETSPQGNALMLMAVLLCGLGYAEGAQLSKALGGWQVISWALIVALPFTTPLLLWTLPDSMGHVTWQGWLSLGYVSLFSMMIGFIFWYRGLAQGGIAAVGQLQLLQPFMGFALAALLLDETITTSMIVVTLGAVLCVAGVRQFGR